MSELRFIKVVTSLQGEPVVLYSGAMLEMSDFLAEHGLTEQTNNSLVDVATADERNRVIRWTGVTFCGPDYEKIIAFMQLSLAPGFERTRASTPLGIITLRE